MPVITMELLPGGTLKDVVDSRGPLVPQHAVDAVLQAIAGLDAAQRAGILHRDVKPSNCFVTLDGTVKIGDYGLSIPTIAHYGGARTERMSVQGTPQFAAPEQLRGAPLDVRADIYAVGATLFYLLTGRAPFEAPDLASLIKRVMTEEAPPAQHLQPDVPEGLAGIVARCLAKDPDSRPAGYDTLREALRPFSSEAPLPARLEPRFAAGAIDHLVLLPVTGLLALGGSRTTFAGPRLRFSPWTRASGRARGCRRCFVWPAFWCPMC